MSIHVSKWDTNGKLMKKRGQFFFTDIVALTFSTVLINGTNMAAIKILISSNFCYHKTHDLSISKILALALFVTCQKDNLTWPAKQYPHHKNV